jgi:hypothetical protein
VCAVPLCPKTPVSSDPDLGTHFDVWYTALYHNFAFLNGMRTYLSALSAHRLPIDESQLMIKLGDQGDFFEG